ncbi:unnamed protein product [Calypogeia fissa]
MEKSEKKGNVFPSMATLTAETMVRELNSTGLMEFLRLAIKVPPEDKICMDLGKGIDIEKGIHIGSDGVHLMGLGVTISHGECQEALRLSDQDLGFAPETPTDLLSLEKITEWVSPEKVTEWVAPEKAKSILKSGFGNHP